MEREESVSRSGVAVAEQLANDVVLRERLVSIAFSRFRIGRPDAEDLLQEATLLLLRSTQEVTHPEGFGYVVFHRCCCRFVEKGVRRRDLAAGACPSPCRPPRDEAVETEMAVALRQGVRRLSPLCRQLLRGHYVEGLSYAEAARAFSRAESGISTLVSRCLARLRKILSPGGS